MFLFSKWRHPESASNIKHIKIFFQGVFKRIDLILLVPNDIYITNFVIEPFITYLFDISMLKGE